MQQNSKEKLAVKKFFTDLAPEYENVLDGELNTFWGWSYDGFVEQLIATTPFEENQRILDVATGTAIIPRKIIQKKIPGVHITGLDITEAMLIQGKMELQKDSQNNEIYLTCGDAMMLPFSDNSFDVVVSGLASHHMNIPTMLNEMKRVLRPSGILSVIDVGSSRFWEYPVVRGFLRIFTYIYFMFKENITRAWAESIAVTNLRNEEGWYQELQTAGYKSIKIRKLSSKYKWLTEPLSIQCIKK